MIGEMGSVAPAVRELNDLARRVKEKAIEAQGEIEILGVVRVPPSDLPIDELDGHTAYFLATNPDQSEHFILIPNVTPEDRPICSVRVQYGDNGVITLNEEHYLLTDVFNTDGEKLRLYEEIRGIDLTEDEPSPSGIVNELRETYLIGDTQTGELSDLVRNVEILNIGIVKSLREAFDLKPGQVLDLMGVAIGYDEDVFYIVECPQLGRKTIQSNGYFLLDPRAEVTKYGGLIPLRKVEVIFSNVYPEGGLYLKHVVDGEIIFVLRRRGDIIFPDNYLLGGSREEAGLEVFHRGHMRSEFIGSQEVLRGLLKTYVY